MKLFDSLKNRSEKSEQRREIWRIVSSLPEGGREFLLRRFAEHTLNRMESREEKFERISAYAASGLVATSAFGTIASTLNLGDPTSVSFVGAATLAGIAAVSHLVRNYYHEKRSDNYISASLNLATSLSEDMNNNEQVAAFIKACSDDFFLKIDKEDIRSLYDKEEFEKIEQKADHLIGLEPLVLKNISTAAPKEKVDFVDNETEFQGKVNELFKMEGKKRGRDKNKEKVTKDILMSDKVEKTVKSDILWGIYQHHLAPTGKVETASVLYRAISGIFKHSVLKGMEAIGEVVSNLKNSKEYISKIDEEKSKRAEAFQMIHDRILDDGAGERQKAFYVDCLIDRYGCASCNDPLVKEWAEKLSLINSDKLNVNSMLLTEINSSMQNGMPDAPAPSHGVKHDGPVIH